MWSDECWKVPVAQVPKTRPVWPLPGSAPKFWVRSFGYKRPYTCEGAACKRWHCGVDLTGLAAGAWIVTTEACTVIGVERGWTKSTRQVFVKNARTYATYGGLISGSSKALGLEAGQSIPAGTRLGKIAGNYNMLHFELYDGDHELTGNQRWWIKDGPPPALLNPINYLQVAAGQTPTRESVPQRHQALHDLGVYAGPIWAPWREMSIYALETAQRRLGIDMDGVWGPKTEAAIAKTLGPAQGFTPNQDSVLDSPSSVFWTRQRKWQLGLGAIGLVGLAAAIFQRHKRSLRRLP